MPPIVPHANARAEISLLPAKTVEKGLAARMEPGFEAGRTVAVVAGPGLRTVGIAATPPVVRVLNALEFKELLPVGTLFP